MCQLMQVHTYFYKTSNFMMLIISNQLYHSIIHVLVIHLCIVCSCQHKCMVIPLCNQTSIQKCSIFGGDRVHMMSDKDTQTLMNTHKMENQLVFARSFFLHRDCALWAIPFSLWWFSYSNTAIMEPLNLTLRTIQFNYNVPYTAYTM